MALVTAVSLCKKDDDDDDAASGKVVLQKCNFIPSDFTSTRKVCTYTVGLYCVKMERKLLLIGAKTENSLSGVYATHITSNQPRSQDSFL